MNPQFLKKIRLLFIYYFSFSIIFNDIDWKKKEQKCVAEMENRPYNTKRAHFKFFVEMEKIARGWV